ncbi:MAG TPA: hypothetical protein DCS24_01585 [Erythrobacter sp.]|mgnify:CR=1 FL=1|nr:hypothetical protein [Erythrobacter sp.]
MAEFMVTPLIVRAMNNENAFNAKSRMAGPFHCQFQKAVRCNLDQGYTTVEFLPGSCLPFWDAIETRRPEGGTGVGRVSLAA